MKKVAIIGMMFLSLGAFAQEGEAFSNKKVCAIESSVDKQSSKMKLAPMREAGSNAVLRTQDVAPRKRNAAKKAHTEERKMVVPLRRKSAKVKAKM